MRSTRVTTILQAGLLISIAFLLQGCPSLITNIVSPNESLQEALDQADSGDTIKILGTHDEDVTIDKDNLTLKGENGATIDGDMIVDADNVTIENMEITGRVDTPPGSFTDLMLNAVKIGFWNNAVITGTFTCDGIIQPGSGIIDGIFSQVRSGGSLCLAPGTYREDLDLAKSIVLRGFTADSGNPVVDGDIRVAEGTEGKLQDLSIKGNLQLPIPSWTSQNIDVEGLYRVSDESGLADRIRTAMGDQVGSFRILRLDISDGIFDGLREGHVSLPFVNTDRVVQHVNLNTERIRLRDPTLTKGGLRSGSISNPDVERVSLPEEQNFQLGPCDNEEDQRRCGMATVLDDEQTMLNAAVFNHPDVRTAYIDPVDLIFDEASDRPSGLHVVYNQHSMTPLAFSDDEQPSASSFSAGQSVSGQHTAVDKKTQVVLDGGVDFYREYSNNGQDLSTMWRRQEANFLLTKIVLWLGDQTDNTQNHQSGFHEWKLELDIKGQEVWIRGGPTTKPEPCIDLQNRLTDPNYFLIHPVQGDEMHLFYTGHHMTTCKGKAAGIPDSNSSAFGDGDNVALVVSLPGEPISSHQRLTLHEVGHLMGGRHSDGNKSGSCPGSTCRISMMFNGSIPVGEDRDLFFTDANDANIENALNSILP